MVRRRLIGGLALVAGLLLAAGWLKDRWAGSAGAGSLRVVKVRRYLPLGARITEADLEEAAASQGERQPGAVSRLSEAVGAVALAPLAAGEQVLANKIARSAASLAAVVPLGRRGVTVPVETPALLDLLEPGDEVDVLATLEHLDEGSRKHGLYTVTIVQQAAVLAVGRRFRPQAERAEDPLGRETASTATLALSSEEAELVAFAEARGRLKLVLRASGDRERATPRGVNFSNVIRPARAPKPAAPPEDPGPKIIPGVER